MDNFSIQHSIKVFGGSESPTLNNKLESLHNNLNNFLIRLFFS